MTISDRNQHTIRTDIGFMPCGVRPHRDGARRVADNLTAFKVTAKSDGFTWLYLSDSRRAYRTDVDTARRFCAAILDALDGGE